MGLALTIAGVASLGFACFALFQSLSYACIYFGGPKFGYAFPCFLGLDPALLPALWAATAGLLAVGVVLDRGRRTRVHLVPPGLGFTILGGAVLEIGTTYVYGAGGWISSPIAPTLLVAGSVLLASGAWSWRRARALADGHEKQQPLPRRAWASPLMALGVALAAFGVFAWIVGAVSQGSCYSIPSYLCYDPGLEPAVSLPFVIAGGVLLGIGAYADGPLRWPGLAPLSSRLALLVLGAGVVEAAVALFLFGSHNIGSTINAYAPTLLIAGGLMVAKGSWPSLGTRNPWRLLVVLGAAGFALDLGFLASFASTAGALYTTQDWPTVLGRFVLVEGAFLIVVYGLLGACAWTLRKEARGGPSPPTRPGPRWRPSANQLLILSASATFGMIVLWTLLLGEGSLPYVGVMGGWLGYINLGATALSYSLIGETVHVVPFVALLLALSSRPRPSRSVEDVPPPKPVAG